MRAGRSAERRCQAGSAECRRSLEQAWHVGELRVFEGQAAAQQKHIDWSSCDFEFETFRLDLRCCAGKGLEDPIWARLGPCHQQLVSGASPRTPDDAGSAAVTCSPDCYQSEVESGSFMMAFRGDANVSGACPQTRWPAISAAVFPHSFCGHAVPIGQTRNLGCVVLTLRGYAMWQRQFRPTAGRSRCPTRAVSDQYGSEAATNPRSARASLFRSRQLERKML